MTESEEDIKIAPFEKFSEFNVKFPDLLLNNDSLFLKTVDVSTHKEKKSLRFEIIVPISTDPHPFILATLATLIATINKIIARCDSQIPDISITFLDWGDVLIEKDFFKKDLIKHYDLVLKDKTPDTFKNLNKIRYYEFQTMIKNIFASIHLNTHLISKIRFKKYYKYEHVHSHEVDFRKYDPCIISEISKFFETHIDDFENEVEAINLKKDLFSFTDSLTNYSITTKFVEILADIGKDSIKGEFHRFLILPEIESKIIQEIINNPFLSSYEGYVQNAIKLNLVTFNEISIDPQVDVPKYYNIISQYYISESDIQIDSLYFATLLKTLDSPLFLPNTGMNREKFFKRILDDGITRTVTESNKIIKDKLVSIVKDKIKEIITITVDPKLDEFKIADDTKASFHSNLEKSIHTVIKKLCLQKICKGLPNEPLKDSQIKQKVHAIISDFFNIESTNLIQEACREKADRGKKILIELDIQGIITAVNNQISNINFDAMSCAILLELRQQLKKERLYRNNILKYCDDYSNRDMEDLTLSLKNGFLKIQYQMTDQFKLII